MNLKDGISAFLGTVAIFTIGYGIALRGEYVIDGARASEIAQEKANAVAQTPAQESIDRERGQLELQRDLKRTRLSLLANRPRSTVDEQNEMTELRTAIDRMRRRVGFWEAYAKRLLFQLVRLSDLRRR